MELEETRICSFKDCSNTTENKGNCCFFQFPADFNLCLQWVESAGDKNFFEDFAYGGALPFKKRYICSDHFLVEDFVDARNVFAGIRPTAVPCLALIRSNVHVNNNSFDSEIKSEPHEMWDPGDVSTTPVFPVELLHNVKVEEVSTQSICFEDFKKSKQVTSPLGFQVPNHQKRPQNTDNKTSDDELYVKRIRRAQAMAAKRARESPEETAERRFRNAQRTAYRRSLESEDQRQKRNRENAERQAKRRQNETAEQREVRRVKDLLRARRRRMLESEEQTNNRRIADAARARSRRENETEDQKKSRKIGDLARTTNKRKNETAEERNERLKKNRDYVTRKRFIEKLEYAASTNLKNLQEIATIDPNFLQSLGIRSKEVTFPYNPDSQLYQPEKNSTDYSTHPVENSLDCCSSQDCFELRKGGLFKKEDASVQSQLMLL